MRAASHSKKPWILYLFELSTRSEWRVGLTEEDAKAQGLTMKLAAQVSPHSSRHYFGHPKNAETGV